MADEKDKSMSFRMPGKPEPENQSPSVYSDLAELAHWRAAFPNQSPIEVKGCMLLLLSQIAEHEAFLKESKNATDDNPKAKSEPKNTKKANK